MKNKILSNRIIVSCPKCGKTLLYAKNGEFEIICSNPKCACKWNVTVSESKIDYDIVGESQTAS